MAALPLFLVRLVHATVNTVAPNSALTRQHRRASSGSAGERLGPSKYVVHHPFGVYAACADSPLLASDYVSSRFQSQRVLLGAPSALYLFPSPSLSRSQSVSIPLHSTRSPIRSWPSNSTQRVRFECSVNRLQFALPCVGTSE